MNEEKGKWNSSESIVYLVFKDHNLPFNCDTQHTNSC